MKLWTLFIFALSSSCYAQDASPAQTPVAVIEMRGNKSTGDASTFSAACKLAGVPDSVSVDKVAYVKFARLSSGVVSVTVKYQNSISAHAKSNTDRSRKFAWKKLLPGFLTDGT